MAETLASLRKIGGGGVTEKVLWTNPSPTSNFAAQTISLDLSGYKAIVLKCSSTTANTLPSVYPNRDCAQQYIAVGTSVGRMSYGMIIEGTTTSMGNRDTAVSTTGVTFGGGNNNYSANNKYAIPIQIIGIK